MNNIKIKEYIQELEFQNTALKAEHNHNIDKIKELEQKESILDKVTDKLKERIKELDNLKENYIKLKEYDQVDFTLCKKREVREILNIIEGEKE